MTPIDPPPGLLDKLAEALNRFHHGPALPWDQASEGMRELFRTEAHAAWDAVAEGLGLREEWRTHFDCNCTPARHDRRERCLVSKWEPQP